jgi:monoamine oxidase
MTLETWLNQQLDRPGARTMLATTVANIFAAEPAGPPSSMCSSTRALAIEQAACARPSLGAEHRVIDRDWSAEEWTRGCYGAHFPPEVWTQLGPSLREPVGRIHWAGTETAERWMGYVDGAIESGIRAAIEVLDECLQPAAPR